MYSMTKGDKCCALITFSSMPPEKLDLIVQTLGNEELLMFGVYL